MHTKPLVLVVDDDAGIRTTVKALAEQADYAVKEYQSATACLDDNLSGAGCLISDIQMPNMNGLEFLEALNARGTPLPVVFITGHGDTQLAVRAMKMGAVDFIDKPFDATTLLHSIEDALAIGQQSSRRIGEAGLWRERLRLLTPRERTVLDLLVAGQSHKVAARELGISHRTVEVHRARIMEKLHAKGLSDLVRIALAASPQPAPRAVRQLSA